MTKPKSQEAAVPQVVVTENKSANREKAALVSEHIGRELRAMFEEVIAEPVPERFRQLLEELERKQPKD